MTTSSTNVSRAGNATKERASVIMTSTPASVVSGGTPSVTNTTTTTGGMSDPVIDEHFRRSLGKDYMSVFAPAIAVQEDTASNIPTESTGLSGKS